RNALRTDAVVDEEGRIAQAVGDEFDILGIDGLIARCTDPGIRIRAATAARLDAQTSRDGKVLVASGGDAHQPAACSAGPGAALHAHAADGRREALSSGTRTDRD